MDGLRRTRLISPPQASSFEKSTIREVFLMVICYNEHRKLYFETFCLHVESTQGDTRCFRTNQ
jgi:hypothetical protein